MKTPPVHQKGLMLCYTTRHTPFFIHRRPCYPRSVAKKDLLICHASQAQGVLIVLGEGGGLIVDFILKSWGETGEGFFTKRSPFYAHFFTKSPLLKMILINSGADQTMKM